MLLVESRQAARTGPDGEAVLLADQDRDRWDAALIAEGQALVREGLRRNPPGPHQLRAPTQPAPSAAPPDWRQVLRLYAQLIALPPTPVVALNRAVGLAEVDG